MSGYLGPVLFFGTAFAGLFIIYESKKSSRTQKRSKENFWERERRANHTRKKDISLLDYIVIPTDRLPLNNTSDPELIEIQDTVRHLAALNILNLSGISNTELKEKYGVANLPELSDYDNNYNTLVNTIATWGSRLYELGCTDDAASVLEYGLSIKSDVSRNYTLLAEIYRDRGEAGRIDALITRAENLNTLLKDSLIKKLTVIRDSADA